MVADLSGSEGAPGTTPLPETLELDEGPLVWCQNTLQAVALTVVREPCCCCCCCCCFRLYLHSPFPTAPGRDCATFWACADASGWQSWLHACGQVVSPHTASSVSLSES
jgi:hypothetical protein